MLGNTWQGLSQAVSEETKGYLSMASMMTDSEVEKEMKPNSMKKKASGC